MLGASCDWLERRLKKEATLVEKNIDALTGLLQLNPAERALLLYGTLARYQRDLRGLLVEFKVSSAQEAYAAIASVAEALRAMLKQTIGGHQSNVCGLYALAAD